MKYLFSLCAILLLFSATSFFIDGGSFGHRYPCYLYLELESTINAPITGILTEACWLDQINHATSNSTELEIFQGMPLAKIQKIHSTSQYSSPSEVILAAPVTGMIAYANPNLSIGQVVQADTILAKIFRINNPCLTVLLPENYTQSLENIDLLFTPNHTQLKIPSTIQELLPPSPNIPEGFVLAKLQLLSNTEEHRYYLSQWPYPESPVSPIAGEVCIAPKWDVRIKQIVDWFWQVTAD
jgi:hypothetical protein